MLYKANYPEYLEDIIKQESIYELNATITMSNHRSQ